MPFPAVIVLHDADARFAEKATSAHLEDDAGTLMRIANLDESFLQAFAHSSSVTFERSTGPIGPFAYRSAGQAVHVFNACVEQRLADWGADAAQFQPGGKKPVPVKKPDTWLSPRQSLDLMRYVDRRQPAPTAVTLRLTIATDGSISACQDADEKHSHADLEKAACGMFLSQHLFEPARDPAGKPVIGVAAHQLMVGGVRR